MADPARPLTVAIPSYQRRDQLVSVLVALGPQLRAAPGEVRVLVGLDGSTDGSFQAVSQLDLGVPVDVLQLDHKGAAHCRNALLDRCTTELIWFLDDDMVPTVGLLARHRAAHADGEAKVVVGPCVISTEAETLRHLRDHWRQWNADIGARGQITSFDAFSVANTSAPLSVFRSVDGLDDRLVGYGYEDYELGLRLLDAGIPIDVDVEAVAQHDQQRSLRESSRNRREAGANLVRFLAMHPEHSEAILHRQRVTPLVARVLALTRRRPALLDRASGGAVLLDRLLHRVAGRGSGRVQTFARDSADCAGISETGGHHVLDRLVATRRERP